ncbi:MAG TPA: penicillin binding protein transpeptidase domain-containing protein [Lentisphaeria bacterium]|nr:MAG: penicillin binding protein transpeptidase domain-containing protein [Lentisphaerae bacterium GWF2_50_93]HCE43224.1 penicillin binding protein transpeptidase domain-containing protein [Lentisphaeria bacterium]
MKHILILILTVFLTTASLADSNVFPIPEKSVQSVFGERNGTFAMIDCTSQAISVFNPEAAREKLPPCSTFKIWNTLTGLENGVISSPGEAFYKWDGEVRFIPEWNKDLTLKEAFQASCVPAFQNLARKIGPERMKLWIDKIGYGDRDISSGIDVFWLPAKGRKTILISPEGQAKLICSLVTGKLPFSEKSMSVLKDIMVIKKTDKGILYGKTGSGADDTGKFNLGWFVGFVQSNGRTYTFSCAIKGEKLMGKDARAMAEKILEDNGFL